MDFDRTPSTHSLATLVAACAVALGAFTVEHAGGIAATLSPETTISAMHAAIPDQGRDAEPAPTF